MDVEEIQPGQNFAQAIEQVLTRCSTVLVEIGPRWRKLLELRTAHNEQDYVVHEVSAALTAKKTVPGRSVACGTGARCERQQTVWLAPALGERCNSSY